MFKAIVGIDEAGLGPLLGPMTVGYSAFELPQPLSADAVMNLDLWKNLGGAIARKPGKRRAKPVVCDSKVIYSPGKGLKALEEEVLAWAHHAGIDTSSLDEVIAGLCPLAREKRHVYPWYEKSPAGFPLECEAALAPLRVKPIASALRGAGVALRTLGVVPVFEGEFNRTLRQTDNKSKAEFEVIGRILANLWVKHRHFAVICDRQGGRAHYRHVLHEQFAEADITIFTESPKVSTYELCVSSEPDQPRMFIAFVEKGDGKHFPVALASMCAKYVRELMMDRLNDWFVGHQPGLKPTAGYYGDGRRFLDDTVELRKRLAIDDSLFIRSK
ncbi:MAG: hypothetical protein IT462_07120 [Planctomycetes bacterium]|nr:hypothetical protein [Planctomycetota bacterium]